MEYMSENIFRLYGSLKPRDTDLDILFFNSFEFEKRPCEKLELSSWITTEGSTCWPRDWLPSKEGVQNFIRVFILRCQQFEGAGMEDITFRLMQDFSSSGLGQHKPFFLVGHSVGGLIIQSFLLCAVDNCNNIFWDNLLGVAFYDVPYVLQDAFDPKVWLNKVLKDLQLEEGRLSGITKEALKAWLTNKSKLERVSMIFVNSLKLKTLCFVELGQEFPENYYALQENIVSVSAAHLSICRPKLKTDPIFKQLVDFIALRYKDYGKLLHHKYVSLDPKKQLVTHKVFGQTRHFYKLKEGLLQSKKQPFGGHIFGVYGMGGVGKSTLAKTIYNDLEVQMHFQGHVYWLIVKKDPDILQKQRALLFELCHKTPPETPDEQVLRSHLQECIKSLQPFLLVLDDVWSKTDIDRILGDPLTDVIPDKCACLITTRIPEELQGFGANGIELDVLSGADSSALFCVHAFRDIEIPKQLDTNLVSIIEETIKACGNLPILLEAIGAERFEKRDRRDWEVTCGRLKQAKNLYSDKYQMSLKSLQISYDSLPDDDLKNRFLDFAAFPEREEIEISQILDLWTTPSFDEDNAYWLLLKLQGRCLVKICGYWCYMHDFMRRLAINIVEENKLSLRKQLFAGHNLKRFPTQWCKVEETTQAYAAEKLILMQSHIFRIPRNAFQFFGCLSRLKVLMLSSNLYLAELPRDVFIYLKDLEKLDLSWCFSLLSLPSEIKHLEKLQKLNISGCMELTGLPPEIGELEELIELNLHSTGIKELPSTIGNCTKIRDLTLDDCRNLMKLPAEIGKLHALEYLDASLLPIQEIPKEIGNLQELRYLKLTGSHITSLPPELGNLRNLETIHLINCTYLSEVPSSLENLCHGKLKDFFIYNTGLSLDKLPTRLKESIGQNCMRLHGVEDKNMEDVDSSSEDEPKRRLPLFDPGDKDRRRMAHGLARMIMVAQTEPFESKKMEMAVRMIYTMANDDQTRHTVIANGGLPVLLRCISESSHDDLASYAGSTLVNMCVTPSTHHLIKDAGGLDVLAAALLTRSHRGRSAYQALAWISNADGRRQAQQCIMSKDFIATKFREHQEEENCSCYSCLCDWYEWDRDVERLKSRIGR